MPARHPEPDPSGMDPSDPRVRLAPDAVLPLFDSDADPNAFDRMLLALATHAEGAGLARAHLLLWAPEHGRLEGRLTWRAPAPEHALERWLRDGARQPSIACDVEGTRRLRLVAIDPIVLGDPLARAWAMRRPAVVAPNDLGQGPWTEAAEVALVPLGGREPYGLLIGEWDAHPVAGEERLLTLRRLAQAALQVRERAVRARQQGVALEAAGAVAAAGAEAHNVAELGQAIASAAQDAARARGALAWRIDRAGAPTLVGGSGPARVREHAARTLEPLVRAQAARPHAVRRPAEEPEIERAHEEAPPRIGEALVLPLLVEGRAIGALAVYGLEPLALAHDDGPIQPGADGLARVAQAAALVFDRADREDDRRVLEARLVEQRERAERAERSSRVGEVAARAARDARNPLASIGAFARRVHRNLAEDDPNREYLEVVIRETERLERAMLEPALGFDEVEGPMRMSDLNALVQETLQRLGEPLVRRRVRLLKRLTPGLPPMLLDADRLRRALHNVIQQAIEECPAGGRIRVETRQAQGHVVVEVAHGAPRAAGELLEQLFVPFQLGDRAAAAMGMVAAQRIVQGHGGEVRVRREGEWGAIVSLTLPVRGNQDRRRGGRERRAVRNDRRTRAAGG